MPILLQQEENIGLAYELSDVSHINIAINKEYFEDLIKRYYNGIIHEFNYEFHASTNLYNYIDKFKRLALQDYQGKDIEMESIIQLISFELIKCGTNTQVEGRHEAIDKKDIFMTIADYIVANCSNDLSIDEICDKYNFSRTYFTKKFSKIFGDPPYQYMLRARISRAKMMLEFEKCSITEIATKCGFQNLYQFSNAFKKRTGISPEEYRNEKQRKI